MISWFNCFGSLESFREDIVAYFFESITLRSEAIVSVAKKVLEGVLTPNTNISKDALKSSLRPILMNLEPKKLSVPLLEGLGRLLFHLRSQFAVTLGDRLCELLKLWTDNERIMQVKVFCYHISLSLSFYFISFCISLLSIFIRLSDRFCLALEAV